MNLDKLIEILRGNPDAALEIRLPDGTAVAPHFHVTELGLVTKDFFDCGGTRRRDESWSLQAWVAEDVAHRLTPRKLGKILALHPQLGASAQLPVRIEYQGETLETYQLGGVRAADGAVALLLAPLHTDCLAKDRCNILPPNIPALPGTACCAPGCC
jgi:hypothetical protein